MPCWPAAEVDRTVGRWLRTASSSQSPHEEGAGATSAEIKLWRSQGHQPAVYLVERLEARDCLALEGEKGEYVGRAICIQIYFKKKKRKIKEKTLEEWFSTKREQFCYLRDNI